MSFVRKPKRLYYSNLDEKQVTCNKTFGRPLSFFLSDKVVSKEKITLIEKDKIVESNINTVQILNTFFLNAISNLKIAE